MPGVIHPGSTGVIYCSDRATANGFTAATAHEWANMGQGAPEAGPIPGAPERPTSVPIPLDSLEYAPTTGVKELRQAVAHLYNDTYRKGKKSQYTYENICIVPGGRAGLSRVASVVGDVYCVRSCWTLSLGCSLSLFYSRIRSQTIRPMTRSWPHSGDWSLFLLCALVRTCVFPTYTDLFVGFLRR